MKFKGIFTFIYQFMFSFFFFQSKCVCYTTEQAFIYVCIMYKLEGDFFKEILAPEKREI